MKYTEMRLGRIFVLSLDPGEIIREEVEIFSLEHGINYATVSVVGAVDKGSILVVGPEYPIEGPIVPLTHEIEAPCEVTGFGTIFPDSSGKPIFHMHGSLGREGKSSTGCFNKNIIAWLVTEVVITELVGNGPVRKRRGSSQFELMTIE
ncbi:MAG TPA: PPC domain-containing DNA-binding protein [Candidatus Methanomethylophilaceae archaeon]|nr:PPC domain-containing DNA-binding protein [Candidatus Methanomethylophilaceae archaeon]